MAQKDKQLSVLQEETAIVDEAGKLKNAIEKKYPTKKPLSKYLVQVGVSIAIVIALIAFAGTKYQVKTEDLSLDLNGEQIVAFADGSYTGTLADGLGDDFGIYEFNTGITYTGNWSNGQYSGQGKMVYPNIGTYEGGYNQGVRTGQGTFTWNDGTVYSGEWKTDKMNGKGTIVYPDGITVSGTFINNNFSNVEYNISGSNYSGTLILSPSKLSANITIGNIAYSGEIDEDGSLNGQAKITYPNGDKFSGTVTKGKKIKGIYTFKNGDSFDGTFVDDKMNYGTYTFSTGQKLECKKVDGTTVGSFVNGVADGNLLYTVNGTAYNTTWKNGKCTGITK